MTTARERSTPGVQPKPPVGASRARYLILWVAFAGLTLNYLDRANLSVALPYMQESMHLELSHAQQGLIFGAFFWAYDGFMLLAGWLADRLGSRRSLALA